MASENLGIKQAFLAIVEYITDITHCTSYTVR